MHLMDVVTAYLYKNSAGGGITAPAVLCDREDRLTPARPFHTAQENPRTPALPLHSGTVAHVKVPEGLDIPNKNHSRNMYCVKLQKSLYGLKQSGRMW